MNWPNVATQRKIKWNVAMGRHVNRQRPFGSWLRPVTNALIPKQKQIRPARFGTRLHASFIVNGHSTNSTGIKQFFFSSLLTLIYLFIYFFRWDSKMEWPITIAWSVEPWKDSVSRRVMLRRSFAAQKTTVFCKNPHTDGYGLEDYCLQGKRWRFLCSFFLVLFL